MYSADEKDKACVADLCKGFNCWFNHKEAPIEYWQAYYDDILERANAAVADGKNVVISFLVYRHTQREYVRSKLPSI